MILHHVDQLFYDNGRLVDLLRSMQGNVQEFVDKIPKEQFLSNVDDNIIANIVAQLTITPLALYEELKTMMDEEVKIKVIGDYNRVVLEKGPMYVPGVKVIVSIPYSGTYDLWHFQSQVIILVLPRGEVTRQDEKGIGILKIIIEQANDVDPKEIKFKLEEQLKLIRSNIDEQKRHIKQHNSSINSLVKSAVQFRRERLAQHGKLADILEIPLEQNSNTPSIKLIDIPKMLVPLAPPPKSGYKPELGITQEVYDLILTALRHVCRTFEQAPETFSVFEEEGLRNIILANLNGYFKGKATGETFRKHGKTDIMIEEEDRSAFIAECKIWHGKKEILEAVDQLLRYLTWRDCKGALIIFNKHNKKISEIEQTIPAILQNHPKIIKCLGKVGKGEWDFIFMSKEDEQRLVYVRVFIFDIFCGD